MAHNHEKEEQQQKTSHSSGTSDDLQPVPMLPPEIIVEILLRLTVESLLRCRSVCKLWCSKISDPRFVKTHLSLSTSNNRYAHHRLVLSVPGLTVKSCPLYDALYDGSVNALELDYPLKHPHHSVWFYGSCNGLLCIANLDGVVVIWNPSTRKSNRLPHFSYPYNDWDSDFDQNDWYYGFGYDESTDDYKVVGISCVLRYGFRDDMIVKIYSLKNAKWKIVDDFHNACYTSDLSVKFLNGALHWSATRDDSWIIVSLDLAEETYGEIVQPVYDEGHNDLKLGVLGEWLCVLCEYRGNRADVWVMKVYGDKDSWTKLVSIPYATDLGWVAPLFISNDGKVLLQVGSELIVYDSKNRSSSKILNDVHEFLEAYTFVESLVSPDTPVGVEENNEG